MLAANLLPSNLPAVGVAVARSGRLLRDWYWVHPGSVRGCAASHQRCATGPTDTNGPVLSTFADRQGGRSSDPTMHNAPGYAADAGSAMGFPNGYPLERSSRHWSAEYAPFPDKRPDAGLRGKDIGGRRLASSETAPAESGRSRSARDAGIPSRSRPASPRSETPASDRCSFPASPASGLQPGPRTIPVSRSDTASTAALFRERCPDAVVLGRFR